MGPNTKEQTIIQRRTSTGHRRPIAYCLTLGALVGLLTQVGADHSPRDWITIFVVLGVVVSVAGVLLFRLDRGRSASEM